VQVEVGDLRTKLRFLVSSGTPTIRSSQPSPLRLREFEVLRPHLVGDAERGSYHVMADELNMTEGAVRVAVHRIRRKYGALLREEVAQTVADPQDVDRELRELLLVLGETAR
jgi:RNA polymerase sigma-70 factor (ECF subfamily)